MMVVGAKKKEEAQPNNNCQEGQQKKDPPMNMDSDAFVLLLVGLPGSGKSTFAQKIAAENEKYVRINQDEKGSRKKCESACRRALMDGKIPIIDRCNFDGIQRSHFLSIAKQFNRPVDAIYFQYIVEECIGRCEQRTDHPTVAPKQARGIVLQMSRKLKPPSHEEGIREIKSVDDFEQADALVEEYMKRERTPPYNLFQSMSLSK